MNDIVWKTVSENPRKILEIWSRLENLKQR